MKKYPFAILILFSSCVSIEPTGHPIIIRNNSQRRVLCSYSRYFPDTTVFHSGITECRNVLSNTTCSLDAVVSGKGWNDVFANNVAGKLIFFILDKDSVDKYGEQVVFVQDSFVLKKYILTFDSLEKMNYTITYP